MSKVWLERKEESWEIKLDPQANTLTLTNEKGEHYGVRWEILENRTTLRVTKYEKSFITGEWRPVVSASLSSLLEPDEDEDEEAYEKPWYLDERELQDFIRREDVEECCKFILKLVKDNFSDIFFDAFLEEATKDKKVE